jgi:hypothetical protein
MSSDAELRSLLVEQVARDMAVLNGDEVYHAPSRVFYEERVASFREAIRELDVKNGGAA